MTSPPSPNSGSTDPTVGPQADLDRPSSAAPADTGHSLEVTQVAPSSAADEPLPVLAAPNVIGRYRLQGRLGTGGFGVVYRAYDDQLQRDVAIKLLIRSEAGHPPDELLVEARLLARLDHPAIVPVYDLGRNDVGDIFIVSKLIDGCDLADLMRRDRPNYRRSAQIVRRVAEALEYAHRQGIIHRDIKPANVLIGSDGTPVLADFGLALRESEFGQGAKFAGTPAYMSPEQARHEGHRVDGRSDVYSLGTVFYELLTGNRPFQAANVPELLELVRNVEVRPPRQLDPQIPRELERICLRAVAKRASDRYSTAGDFAEDLRHWEVTQTLSTSDLGAASQSGRGLSVPGVLGSSDSRQSIKIVPRGLRPFESADSDFFLHLVPGPRDRDGVPESIRFWKGRIEDSDSDTAFRVGLLLGPSGSGKSSLIRAGVLPRLDEHVLSVFVEGRADGFERRLVERLHRRLPALQDTPRLRDCLTLIRQRRGLPAGRKVLIIVDQFEQWLNLRDAAVEEEVTDAFRQCDGVTLQVLLLVRDDFTFAATRLMEAIEEPLLQNRNFATAELPGVDHARRVLEAYGRSFGTLPESPTKDQQRFLETAVQELASNGHVIPVRLAVFAEMVKDKPWTMTTLQQFGGMDGIGVAFLDDRLGGPNAHPDLRANLPLARALLQKLLPDDEGALRGRARSRQELAAVAPAGTPPEQLDRLLGLLDTETRLVTPTGGETTASTRSQDEARELTYQLAHDYLVPALRSWLSAEERSTRRGRARFRLRELAEFWSRKPEPQRLPTWTEWASIRWMIPARNWAPTEQAMMRVAGQRLLRRCSLGLATLLCIVATAWGTWTWYDAQLLVESLLNSDTAELPTTLRRLDARRLWTTPLLAQAASSMPATDLSSLGPRELRRRLHVATALAHRDPAQRELLVTLLPQLPPAQLLPVRRGLRGSRDWNGALWWQLWQTEFQHDPQRALALGAMVLEDQPDPVTWQPYLTQLGTTLAGVRPSQITTWCELWKPLGRPLTPILLDLYRNTDESLSERRANLLEALVQFATEDWPTLAAALERTPPREQPFLLALATNHQLPVRTELRKRLLATASRNTSAPALVPEELAQQVRQRGGWIQPGGCLLYSVSRGDWDELAPHLAAAGYSVTSLRWHSSGPSPRLAVSLTRSNASWETDWELDVPAARQAARERPAAGWALVDFGYREPLAQSSGPEPPRWTFTWRRATAGEGETRIYVDEPLVTQRALVATWSEEGLVPERADWRMLPTGEALLSGAWQRVSEEPADYRHDWRYANAAGDRFPGETQLDLRAHTVAVESGDPLGWYERYVSRIDDSRKTAGAAVSTADAARTSSDSDLLNAARFLSETGDFSGAANIVAELAPRWKTSVLIPDYEAVNAARSGQRLELAAAIDRYLDLERRARTQRVKPGRGTFLKLRHAALTGDAVRVERLLDELRSSPNDTQQRFDLYVHALAVVAGTVDLGATADRALEQLLEVLRAPAAVSQLDEEQLFPFGADFAAVRARPAFAQFLRERGWGQRWHSVYSSTLPVETRVLYDQPTASLERESATLSTRGFSPAVLECWTNHAGELRTAAVWRRPIQNAEVRRQTESEQTNLILALASLSDFEELFRGLRGDWGRNVRSSLMVSSATVLPVDPIVERLLTDGGLAPDFQQMLLLTLGGTTEDRVGVAWRDNLRSRLEAWSTTAENAGLRAAADWVRQRWNLPLVRPSLPAPERADWTRNALGQVMVKLRAPALFQMGSPSWEEGHSADEGRHWARLENPFWIADTEVTDEQFRRFLDDPKVRPYYASRLRNPAKRFGPDPHCPRLGVDRLDAQRFCQWLSEQDGIPLEQTCYPDVWKRNAQAVTLTPDQLRRPGYRLPTEIEWEFAARAGSSDAFWFGDDERTMPACEWISRNSGGRSHQVGQLRPNDFGLFDMLGNASEWTADLNYLYLLPASSPIRTQPLAENQDDRKPISRGGHFGSLPASARAAKRTTPSGPTNVLGFRVARTAGN